MKELLESMSGVNESPPLVEDEIESLVLEASREFYDNADSGDSTTGLMKMAFDWYAKLLNLGFAFAMILRPTRSCSLRILPANKPKIRAEMDLIEATHALSRIPNLEILPMEIRMATDRIALIQKALKTSPSTINYPDRWLEIGRKLSLAKQDSLLTEVRVRAYIADAAIDFENWDVASMQCNGLVLMTPDISVVVDVIWQVCLRLATNPKYHDLDDKMRLLGHVTALCPSNQIGAALDSWTRVCVESSYDSFTGLPTECNLVKMEEMLSNALQKDVPTSPNDRLAIHEFYQKQLTKTHVDMYNCDGIQADKRIRRLVLLRLLARIEALLQSEDAKSASKINHKQSAEIRDNTREIAKAAFSSDAALTLCSLLHESVSVY